ncbi:MAG: hypothetical protein J2O48_02565 [Solirubrobacterales bacterium]|nr:hypothetical protein [Solirubrobacterales bacterium]
MPDETPNTQNPQNQAAEPPAAAPQQAPQGHEQDQPPEISALRKEAAGYRTRLRETEAELEQLRRERVMDKAGILENQRALLENTPTAQLEEHAKQLANMSQRAVPSAQRVMEQGRRLTQEEVEARGGTEPKPEPPSLGKALKGITLSQGIDHR